MGYSRGNFPYPSNIPALHGQIDTSGGLAPLEPYLLPVGTQRMHTRPQQPAG